MCQMIVIDSIFSFLYPSLGYLKCGVLYLSTAVDLSSTVVGFLSIVALRLVITTNPSKFCGNRSALGLFDEVDERLQNKSSLR